MSCRGYTLIELLVVISIIGILSVAVFVNFQGFSQDQVLSKGLLQMQNALRFAQSNATSGALCWTDPNDHTKGNFGGTAWSAEFESDTVKILCDKSTNSQKTFTLEGVTVGSIKASGCGNTNISLPFKVTYASINGNVSFGKAGDDVCLTTNSSKITFTLKNPKNNDPNSNTKPLTISKGGAIDVQ